MACPGGRRKSPKYRAFAAMRDKLTQQLQYSFTALKDQCFANGLLTAEEESNLFHTRGANDYHDTSKLMEVILKRIDCDPNQYDTFRELGLLQDRAHEPLTKEMGQCI